jgi:hypothetical protein
VRDQKCPVDWLHAQPGNILDQELLDLLVVSKLIIDNDRCDFGNAE